MSLLIFSSCRDCPPYLTSSEIVHDLLLPAETTVHEKWLPAETVHVILLPAKTWQNHMDSLCRKPLTKHNSLSRGQSCSEAKYDGQSLQEAKIRGLVYIICEPFENLFLVTR